MSLDVHTMSDVGSNSPSTFLPRPASRSSVRRHGVRDETTQVEENLANSLSPGNFSGRYEATFGLSRKEDDALTERINALKSRKPGCFIALTKNVVQIIVKAMPIESQETDVIVNSTKSSLNIGGMGILNRKTVTYALSKAAGPVARESLRKLYPRGISTGEMAIGDAGNLQCKKLYHVVLESFGSSRQGAKTETLKRVVNNCLQTAEQMGYTSITFPALGTGNLGYPPELVAKTMLDCFVNYATTQRNTPITEIAIVTGIRETGPVYTAFQMEEQRRVINMIQSPGSETLLVQDPQWLCPSYMHIVAHSRQELECIVDELSRTRRSSYIETS